MTEFKKLTSQKHNEIREEITKLELEMLVLLADGKAPSEGAWEFNKLANLTAKYGKTNGQNIYNIAFKMACEHFYK
jgi:hypothetical protein